MEFRQAAASDLRLVVDNRIEFALLMKNIKDLEQFRASTERYMKEHLGSDDFVAYLALEQGKVISSCMASIYVTAPVLSCPSGKTAEIINVFTRKDQRKKGYSYRLLTLLLEELKRRGVSKVLLGYTPDGFCLYKKLGFEEVKERMQKKL